MVKRILALSLLMVGLMGLSGCGDGGDAGPAALDAYTRHDYVVPSKVRDYCVDDDRYRYCFPAIHR